VDKITATDIRQALVSAYASPEWYIGFEVGNSTGANCRRHADAVAINSYPSKGFEVRGFEIKVSKSDLKAELTNGIKSDEIARFCDYWFLVVPKGLANEFTLPPTWGVIEYIDGGLRQKVKAEKLQHSEPTIGFLCAMLRGRERVVLESAHKVTAAREEQIRQNTLWSVKNSEQELNKLREKLAEVKAATGIELSDWRPAQDIIDRLNAARYLDIVAKNLIYLKNCAKELTDDAQKIQSAIDTIYANEEGKNERIKSN
jgi:hypothetical protein